MYVFLDVANEVFNRCCAGYDKARIDSKDYKLTFNYEFLEDFQDEKENACSKYFKRLFMRYGLLSKAFCFKHVPLRLGGTY